MPRIFERTGDPVPAQLSGRILDAEDAIPPVLRSHCRRNQRKQEIPRQLCQRPGALPQLKACRRSTEAHPDDACGMLLRKSRAPAPMQTPATAYGHAPRLRAPTRDTPIQAARPNVWSRPPTPRPEDISLTLSRVQDPRGRVLTVPRRAIRTGVRHRHHLHQCAGASVLDRFHDTTLGIGPDGSLARSSRPPSTWRHSAPPDHGPHALVGDVSSVTACSTRPSMICAVRTPAWTASTASGSSAASRRVTP